MTILDGFIIPLLEVIAVVSTLFIIIFIFARALFKATTRKFTFWLRYSIFKAKIPDEVSQWCLGAIEKDWDEFKIKKFLLIKGLPQNQVNETVWIFKKIEKEVYKNARGYKGNNQKSKRKEGNSEFPSDYGERETDEGEN